MSEPVTNVEIEDVLSSIRRLVSEDDRPQAPQKPVENAEKSADRLVLTPALRVAPSVQEPQEHMVEEHADAPEEIAADGAEVQEDLSETVPQTDVGEAQTAAEDLPEADEDGVEETEAPNSDEAMAAPDEIEATTAQDDAETEVAIDAEPVELSDESKGDAAAKKGVVRLEDRIAGLESAVANRDDQWEPDGASDDDYAGGPVEALAWEDVEDADVDRVADLPDAEMDEVDITDEEIYADVDDAESDDQTVTEAEPVTVEADESDLFGTNEAFLDEESLREMVSEIVRQELQGSLGERITRNVRKLVRREIHRALTSQDLD